MPIKRNDSNIISFNNYYELRMLTVQQLDIAVWYINSEKRDDREKSREEVADLREYERRIMGEIVRRAEKGCEECYEILDGTQ